MSKLTISHTTDAEWSSKYMSDPLYRLTHLVQTIDPSLLSQDFQNMFITMKADKKLLFRSKSVNTANNSITIINFFDSAETYDGFSAIARRDEVFEVYRQLGLTQVLEMVDDIDASAEIDKVMSDYDESLIQYCDESLYRAEMGVTGDPLK